MVQKVNGAAYSGIWVERNTAFVKVTFSKDIVNLAAADLVVLGTTTPVGAGTVADSSFAVVESALVQAIKVLETRATVLGISRYDDATFAVDVFLGHAEGWFSDDAGLIAEDQPVVGAQAAVTTAATAAPTNAIGDLVGVKEGTITFKVEFSAWNGTMEVATEADGDIVLGPGATSGATPPNSPTGTPGYYPVTYHAS